MPKNKYTNCYKHLKWNFFNTHNYDFIGQIILQKTLQEYRRKGVLFLAAAIGQDKEIISDIYGKENTLDITDLKQLPARLVQIISRYL